MWNIAPAESASSCNNADSWNAPSERALRKRLRKALALLEGYYSIFKRGVKGIYQPCAENTCIAMARNLISDIATARRLALDMDRADKLAASIVKKRLTYRRLAGVREKKMIKKSDELSQSEKIDDLRKDVKTIFSHLES